ncbi:GLPGLI family protein [Segetibacter sp. 3557_3]|uniref:GLPGLI family protein n=1 Tax=Segetibacter sp. 3557_3 TaxID=2547429 RepID=UPI001058FE14|nr:GLPGLI family protein [Segetibacter sp. 3557_3]TDH26518.1 GLPGLI family protein [Segetibacter sp. 3557_3]
MNPTKLIAVSVLLFFIYQGKAQQTFIPQGKIEFEKRVNLYKNLEAEEDESWRNMLKQTVPQYKVNYFDLYFTRDKAIYQPGREAVGTQKIPDWVEGPANDNIVFTDFSTGLFNSQKTVFESIFNIQDTLQKIDWKISTDSRTIAGFECRKATAIIMDSVFVVAFYTDQILTSAGPESFTGLPGMILGLALPRLNTTYFATKVELAEVKASVLLPPKKGKKTNIPALRSQLKESMKSWGKWGDRNIWLIMI